MLKTPWVYICSIFLFALSFKECNKLDKYIYTDFYIIQIINLNNFFYNKNYVCVIQKLDYIWLVSLKQSIVSLVCYITSNQQTFSMEWGIYPFKPVAFTMHKC